MRPTQVKGYTALGFLLSALLLTLTWGGRALALDPIDQSRLTLSSTLGGEILRPEEPFVVVDKGQSITIKAQSVDPNYFVFSGWTGAAVRAGRVADPDLAQTTVLMDADYNIRAHFVSTQVSLYVDANNTPSRQYGTSAEPLLHIQDALDVSQEGTQIWVRPVRYSECLDFPGKNIQLLASEATDSEHPIIDCNGPGPILSFTRGEGVNCVVSGFEITGGLGEPAGAIYCRDSSPSLYNCLVVGNRCSDPNGAAIALVDSNALFVNCTLVDNVGGANASGLLLNHSFPTVTNCIIWNNTPVQWCSDANSVLTLQYSDTDTINTLADQVTSLAGNIDGNPLFIQTGYWGHRDHPAQHLPSDDPNAVWIQGDYHLQSSSPCIDKGMPSTPFPAPLASDWDGDARVLNQRVDIGADETLPPLDNGIFVSPVLKQAIEDKLGYDDPTPEDMQYLTVLIYRESIAKHRPPITSLEGLEYAVNLQTLELIHNTFSDLSPLAGLTQLQSLVLNNNRISNIQPLAHLTLLTYLDFHDNKVRDLSPLAGLTHLQTLKAYTVARSISDISVLSGLTQLREVYLNQNSITDIFALTQLHHLQVLTLQDNPLSSQSCNDYVPQIITNNPGIVITHSCDPIQITLQSSSGGSIVNPPEGTHLYYYGDTIILQAQADPGYTFTGFSGNYSSSTNPAFIQVKSDMTITANFSPIH